MLPFCMGGGPDKVGHTKAYAQYWQRAEEGQGFTKGTQAQVQEKIKAPQACIHQNFYACTDEILKGLGQIYVANARFREAIDGAGGQGTAAFIGQTIEAKA